MFIGAKSYWNVAGKSNYKRRFYEEGRTVKKILGFLLMIGFVFYCDFSFAQELFMCKNVFIKEPISREQVKTLREEQAYSFSPGNRIVAIFIFHPKKDAVLEFRWIAPFKERQPPPYFHRVRNHIPGKEYAAYAWIVLDASFLDRMMGSKYEGIWQVEVYLDTKKIATKSFEISS